MCCQLKNKCLLTDTSDTVMIDVPIKSVVKILFHLGRSLPVFFIYVKPSTAANIRRLLKMNDKNGYYFDPCSYGEFEKCKINEVMLTMFHV